MQYPIMSSVGDEGVNIPQDVGIVQNLLNLSAPQTGVPDEPLEVDGIVGPKTLAAISAFQDACCPVTDGRVDPNGATIKKLNEMAAPIPRLNTGYAYLTPFIPPPRIV